MPSSEPHPSQYHLQHHNIPPSHLQQHSSNAIGQHQLYQQLVAAHHQQQQHHQQQHGGPFQNSTYAQQKQEMSPEEEGGRGGGSPPAAGAALHQPHHPRTASPPSGTEPCTRDAIPTPTPVADTTTTTISIQSQGQQQTQQQGPSPSPSPTGGDVEKFDGKIVYNPDGSAYIIEGESELSEDDSLPDGCIVDGRGMSVPHSLVFPQIASAYYVSRLYAHQAYQQQQQQQQRSTTTQQNPDLPVMHSYRVISYRSAEGSKQPPPQTVLPPPAAASVPVKPILMCFICKLSFGYAKSFVAHAQGEHQLTLMEDERQVLSHSTASAIIQAVGRGKQPLVSFLEPVTSSTCTSTSPGQTQAQLQQRSESSEHEVPTTTSTPASTPGIPSSPQQQQQQRPSPSTPTTPTSHSSHPLAYNHQHQWPGAQVSAASWAKAPDAAMHYTSPPPSASTKGSPSSYAALTQQPPNFLTGTTIGVCPEHIQGRPSGVECPKCELILASSRLAGPGGPLAGIHSRNSCKTLKCPKCNWHYKYQETLEIHMKEKHPESETSCIYCIAGQPHPRLARGETYTCGYKPYRCEVCNYSTTTKGNLSIHMQSDKHLNNMQEIQQGGGGSSGANNPSSSQDAPLPTRSPHHQQNHSPHLGCQTATQGKPKPTFRCDVCNYETSVARNLRIHMTSEKHTHNMLVLQQNVKQMHALSALQSHHQQAQQHHHQQAQHQQQLEQLIHLGGLDKPQHAEAALADMAYNQALLIQMMTGGQLPPQLPPELMGGMASMSAIGNLGGDVGLSPDSMEPPPEPADPDPTHLYHCCVCNNFGTDSLEALGHHLAADRTRTREGEILALVAGHFVCKLCSYKTNLKANFQLHCKTDKHLQRLQHVNHVKEGGPRNEWKLKYLASPTSAAQLRCHACDYYTNSAHKLALHAASPRHEAAALLLRHLLEASSNVPSAAKLYHCALCMFSARHRLPLLQHVRSLRHLQMEQMHQIHRRSSIQGNETPHTDIGDVFQVVPDPDVSSAQQSSPTTPTTPNAANTNNERREEGSDCGSEVKQEPDNEPEHDQEPEVESDEVTCPYCTYQPTSREELRQHMQVAHVQDPEERAESVKEEPTPELLCPLCQDGFRERSALEKHVMQIHSVNADGLQRLLLLVDQSHWLNNNPRNTSTPAATPTSPSTMAKQQQDEEMSERGGNEEVEETARCSICGRVCRSLEELQQHHREAHPATTPTLAVSEKHVYKYRCGQCSLAFKTLEKLQQHSQYHAIRDATKCALCGRCFRSVQALQRHLESAHADLQEDELAQYKQSLLHAHPLLQALTEEALRRQGGVMSEQNTEDEGRGDEEESDASDSSPLHKEQRLLEDYLNSQPVAEDSYHDPGRKFKCHRCKVAFTRQSYLTGHNKTLLHRKGEKMSYPMEKYLDPNRPYKCDVCKESFTQKNILLVHYNSVSHLHKLKRAMQEQGNNNTLISVVPPASPTESSDAQQDQDKKPYKCNICKVAYSQGSTLDIHMRSVLHQTRAGKLQDLAASGQVDLGRPLIEQPPPTSPNSPPSNANAGNGNSMLSCSRCSALFVNQEQLATHQQLYCIFSNPLALFQQLAASQQMASAPSKTPPPTSSTPGAQNLIQQQAQSQQSSQTQDILSQPRHKTSQMYKHLLESFGFDLVMQFNENHQRRQRKEEEAAAALQAQQEQQKQEQQKQALAVQAAQEKEEEVEEHVDEDVIPELTRSTCQHCNKEFSSVWVLKAHCEEVHRDLVPREFLEKYAQQFKCEYEKKSVVVTAATSSSTTTAPRSTTPASNQPQDLSSEKEQREREKEETPEIKENISRTPEATSTTPTTTPALSNTPVSSTDSGTPTVLTANTQQQMQQHQQQQQQQQQQHAPLTLVQQMSEMQAAFNAVAASQLQQHLQQYPGLVMGMMGLPLGLNVPALAAMNLQPPLVPMMLPPPPYDGASGAYPPINSQADLLAKQHLALQQQQAAVANAAASQKRARTRITDEQLKILRAHFDINNSPGEEQILDMAAQSGLPPKVIKHWFRNTLFKERQRNKDSPYNFNNPPSTTLNLEEYEKTGEAKVTPLNSSVSGSSSSDDKSPNKQASPPPLMTNISTPQPTEIKQEIPDQSQCLQQQQDEQQPHNSPGSSGGQQSRPHSPALSMSSVFSGLHHELSSHAHTAISAPSTPSTPMLPPKLTPQNFSSQTPGVVGLVPSSIAALALTPQRSLSPGRGPADYSFGGNSNGSNSSGGSSGKRANRTRFTDYQIKVLQEFFENNAYPKDDDLEYLSKLLGLSPRVIVVWFQNARQKARKVYENQPAAEPVAPGGREGDDGSGRFQRTPGLNYQCKKCLLVFQRYYELIRHQKTHCFKEEDAKRSAQAQAAAAQVAAVLSSEDSNSSSTTTTNAIPNNPTSTPALAEQLQQPLVTTTPPHQQQQQNLSHQHQQQPPQSQTESKEGSFQCDKCNLMFGRFELWREHQLVHIMNPSLFPPAYPPDSPFGILQQQALNATTGVASDSPHPLIAMMQERKRKFEDFDEVSGENRPNTEHNEQPKDKRLRTTILPEQLDYLYQKYQVESNPSRKMLETIAREVGLKKRVVQVWFQNTRARERKGQFRAHSQVINKRCPFCPALFKVKSALESHLSSKHADQVARGEVNIDNIPDEELSMESAPSNPSTPNMMPPLFPPFNTDMEASLKKYYEESMKRYISELQAHTSNGKQEPGSNQSTGNSGESPLDLSKPVDLSRPMKLSLGGLSSLLEEQHAHLRGGSDCGPLTDLSERSICDDDSLSETTEFLDDESGPASPASSTQSSRQGTAGGGSIGSGGPAVTGSGGGGQSGGKRYRTQMSATQVKVMKSLFSDYKTPTMAECEMLGREIGLPKRVVQVWFQNARAKEKKARLAAGLPAEGSAVQPHRGPTGPDECRLCSVRYSPKSPLQEHVFSRRHIESVRVAVEDGSLVPPTPGAPIHPGSAAAGPTVGSQQGNQQQADENMMYGSLFLHPTAMFQQQQHTSSAATSTATTTAGECLADLLDS